MILFYASECDGKTAILLDSEAIHCKQALRKNVGDEVFITDGLGKSYLAFIIAMNKKKVDLGIKEEIFLSKKRDYKIHIAIAPTKNIARFEWFLEKATEFGIDEITPILCHRSERKNINEERLEKILVSAMKQSLKNELPVLNPLTKFDQFINNQYLGSKYIAHLEEGTSDLVKKYPKGNNAIILIGPEGDFSPQEIEHAAKQDFVAVSLGDYRLRTETAGISAVQAIHFCNSL